MHVWFEFLSAGQSLSTNQASGFINQWMLEGSGVVVQDGCFEVELSSGLAPAGNSRENFAEIFFCLGRLEAKARRGGECAGDGWFFLIFRDGGFAHADTIHFRHGVDVVGRRE